MLAESNNSQTCAPTTSPNPRRRNVVFQAVESPRNLFAATSVRMYVDDEMVEEKTLWRDEVEFVVGSHLTGEETQTYVFDYPKLGAKTLRWKCLVDSRPLDSGLLSIANQKTARVALLALFLWSVVWFAWLLPAGVDWILG